MVVLPFLQGSEGVEQVLQILKDEFKLAMMLTGRQLTSTLLVVSTKFEIHFFFFLFPGCDKLSDIKQEMVVHEAHYKCSRL